MTREPIRREATEHIREALTQATITLLQGAPGVGKSWALDALFAFSDDIIERTACVFLRLTARDSMPEYFLWHLADALRMRIPPSYDEPERFIEAIRRLPAHTIIVLDELHLLGNAVAPHTLLNELIETTTRPLRGSPRRWLLSTRRSPLFPQAVWLADGRARLLEGDTILTLTAAESAELIESSGVTSGKPLRLHGTIRSAALNLAQLIAKERRLLGSRKQRRTAHSSIARFIDRLQPRLVETLTSLSLIQVIRPSLLQSTTLLDTEVVAILADLGLIHADPALGGFALDSALALELRTRLSQAPVAHISAATRLALHVGPHDADIRPGFTLLEEAEVWPELVALLEEFGFALLDRETLHGCVSHALAILPARYREQHPILTGLAGAVNARVGFGDIAESWFQNALNDERLVGAAKQEITYRYAVELLRRNRPDARTVLDPLRHELEANPAQNPNLFALVKSLHAAIAAQQNDRETAKRALRLSLDALDECCTRGTRAYVLHAGAYTARRLDNHQLAISLADEALLLADAEALHDLGSRTASIRQELAYMVEHDATLTATYLDLVDYHATLAGEARMQLFAWLTRFWLGVEAGDLELMISAQRHIEGSEACDDYMQAQLRQTIVPGIAIGEAWNGAFSHAAHLVEHYARSSPPGRHRAYRWSELAIYYAAIAATTNSSKAREQAAEALHEARLHLTPLADAGGLGHENDILARIALTLILLQRRRGARILIGQIAQHAAIDHRAATIAESLACLSAYCDGSGTSRTLRRALTHLNDIGLGGIARLIAALPDPTIPYDTEPEQLAVG